MAYGRRLAESMHRAAERSVSARRTAYREDEACRQTACTFAGDSLRGCGGMWRPGEGAWIELWPFDRDQGLWHLHVSYNADVSQVDWYVSIVTGNKQGKWTHHLAGQGGTPRAALREMLWLFRPVPGPKSVAGQAYEWARSVLDRAMQADVEHEARRDRQLESDARNRPAWLTEDDL